MARYGQKFKDAVVARLLPPESSSLEVVSQKVGISVATLERWRATALASTEGVGAQQWTPAARLEAVIVTAANLTFADSEPDVPALGEKCGLTEWLI